MRMASASDCAQTGAYRRGAGGLPLAAYAVWGWQPGTSTSAKAGLSDREMRNALDVCGLGGADLGGSLLRAYSVGADSGQLHREAVELGTGLHHMHSANGSAPPRNTVHQGETPARAH